MGNLEGVCVPVCTVFSEDGGELDEAGFLRHLDSMLEAGVPIIAVNGGTGEFPFLSEAEKRRIAEISARHLDGKAKLVVQTSAIRTEDAIEASKHAEGCGADALLVLPPYFEGPGESGVLWHYERVARAVSCEIMAYNIPVFSGFDVTPEIFARLREFDGIAYLKDSSGDMLRLEQLVASGAKVFNGCDYLMFYGLLAGCTGCFWGGANAMPAEAVQLYEYCVAGRHGEAQALWPRMKAASAFFWTHPFNPSVKAATELSGRPVGQCRKPVLPIEEAELQELRAAMAPLLEGADGGQGH